MVKFHIVKSGDTLWSISNAYHIELNKIVEWNDLYGRKKHIIYPGQKIYLSSKDENYPVAETTLSFKILDYSFKPIKNAQLMLEFDSKSLIVKCDSNGEIQSIDIMNHMAGLKVYFQKINGSYALIAYYKILPLGKKKLTLTSRTFKLKGNTLPEKGGEHKPAQVIKQETIEKNKTIHDAELDNKNNNQQERKQSIHTDNKKSPSNNIQKNDISNLKYPQATIEDVRTENGKPSINIAQLFTAENLKLTPINEKYRKYIIDAARKFGFSPQALAAKVNAEAAKTKDGEWKADSQNTSTSAGGLTQALDGTWLSACRGDNEQFKKTLLYKKVNHEKIVKEADRLILKYNAELSIDFGAAYAKQNIEELKKNYNLEKIDKLTAEDLAKLGYLAHHEGAKGANNQIMHLANKSWASVQTQVGEGKILESLKKQFPDDPNNAYRWWLMNTYVDGMINVKYFMHNTEGVKPRTMEEIAIFLGGKSLVKPKANENQSFTTESKSNINNNVIFDIKFVAKDTLNIIKNYKFILNSPYGSKLHSTDSLGLDKAVKASVNDKLVILTGNNVLKEFTVGTNQPTVIVEVPFGLEQKAEQLSLASSSNSSWYNPLASCVIRTAGLASARSATFGKVRNNNTRNHQGIDFAANSGTNIIAVANGRIISIVEEYSSTVNFGAFIVLQCQIDDLPEPQKTYARNKVKGDAVWFFYAHLSYIEPKLKTDPDVRAGTILGKTGSSGNASGMSTIEKGGHLHFEARHVSTESPGKGLIGRFDPLPFFPSIPQP
ncbi:LysM peptidoglycan-binding domain-containing M23 family metallopeptidase [Acinetobacter populi]|uniref:LysM domain-containing protein n=1 Tax=Acinetobacter populi TaxID=1582270 RepID=A0A1Z9YTI5_9GAMM|nr:peptidoglycan DD-metalloendopeptidase family protein [Acinetobacter populi]OUY05491.1 hypothetical protein CAP51_17095 [Acinetobacter populi]